MSLRLAAKIRAAEDQRQWEKDRGQQPGGKRYRCGLPDTYFRVPDCPDRKARLAAYAALAAVGLPLFGSGPGAAADDGRPHCAGCGEPAPQPNRNANRGWRAERVQVLPDRPTFRVTILTCPDCLTLLQDDE